MKEGQGSLFKNEKQNDRQPDFKGRIMIGGAMYEVAGWQRTAQNGKNYISLQAALPREKTDAPASPVPAPSADDYIEAVEDDLPF